MGAHREQRGTQMAPEEHIETDETVGDADDVVAEDLLVEDVSIDGMCGVY